MSDIYKMTIITFGSVYSQSCAQEVKNINSKDFEPKFLEAAKAIIEHHYVDDYLDGAATEELAIKAAQDATVVNRFEGFQISNLISRSCGAMENIPQIFELMKQSTWTS